MAEKKNHHQPIHPKFVDVNQETERLKELDHFWLEIENHPKEWLLWRFSYLDADSTEKFLPHVSIRFNEPILLIHGLDTSHTVFNWFARELWRFGFRNIFAIDPKQLEDINTSSDVLALSVQIIQEITEAHRISLVAHASGGIIARFFSKFKGGAKYIRVLAMIGSPHGKTEYVNSLRSKKSVPSEQLTQTSEYLEDIRTTVTEDELYYLTQINIGGSVWSSSSGSDIFKHIPLADAINISVSETHLRVHKHKLVFRLLQPFLIPQVAIFKIRLLTFVNIKTPIFLRIHCHDRLTQVYPRQGVLAPDTTKKIFIPEVPVIIFSNNIRLDQTSPCNIVIYAYKREGMTEKLLGKVKFMIKLEKFPYVDYETIWGVDDERIDLAIYAYVP
ncbi:MAG: esterase/lipase family protein [Candidatus Hodarchaeales archaeon]